MVESGGLNPYKDRICIIKAMKMYEQIRRRKTDIINIVRHTNFSIEQVQIIKNYIFYDSHELSMGYSRFNPSFEMTQSWLRLSEKNGNNIQSHDVTLLYHELYEIQLLLSKNKCSQSRAHMIAEKKYNYSQACKQFYGY